VSGVGELTRRGLNISNCESDYHCLQVPSRSTSRGNRRLLWGKKQIAAAHDEWRDLELDQITLGLAIIFGRLDIINAAHADRFMVGTELTWAPLQMAACGSHSLWHR
jgi:hypothetical protein